MKLLGIILTASVFLCAQTTFEVASVRPRGPNPDSRSFSWRGGPGTDDPGVIHWHTVSMRKLLMEAYGLKPFQVTSPAWVGKEFYDVDAKLPAGTTREQLRLMLQALLSERFHLAAHLEKQPGTVYELVVARGGAKLKPSPAESSVKPVTDGPIGPNGQPILQRARHGVVELPSEMKGKGHIGITLFEGFEMRVRQEGLEYLIHILEGDLERPVIDKTGLTGPFDYTLAYLPPRMATAPVPEIGLSGEPEPRRADLFTALQSQLGLKLEARTLPTDVLVVDRIEKTPTDN